MSKYLCPMCGKIHTDGTKTLRNHAKQDMKLREYILLRTNLKKPFQPWQFYFLVWEQVSWR